MINPHPLFLIDLLKQMGLGEALFWTLAMLFVAFELFRGLKAGRRVGSIFGRMMGYAILILVVTAGAIGFGWVDPNPGVVIGHLGQAAGFVVDVVWQWVSETVAGRIGL